MPNSQIPPVFQGSLQKTVYNAPQCNRPVIPPTTIQDRPTRYRVFERTSGEECTKIFSVLLTQSSRATGTS